MQLEVVRTHLHDAHQELDGSLTATCMICETDGHRGKKIKIFRKEDGQITGVSCSRFASAGADANRKHCAPIREALGLGATKEAFVSSTLFEGDRQVNLEVEPFSKGVQFVTARNCTAVLHSAEIRLGRPDERAAFVAKIPDREDSEREAIARELVQLFDRYRKARAAASDEEAEGPDKQSAATRLVAITSAIQLIHNADGDGFAMMMIEGHKEVWPLRSKGFKRWLQRRFFEQFEKAPGSQAVQDALGVIEGKALYDGPERKIFTRIGEKDGKIYLDLADEEWRAVEIDAAGWRVVTVPPVEFRRAKGMLALPVPTRDGNIEGLRPFLSLQRGDLWTLMLGSLVMKFHPRGPYPVDVLTGRQGSGKTTRARVIRELVDPSSAPTRSAPREIRDLQIAATNEWLPVFDNLSRLPEWLSDGLCCLSTGGGMRTRELYSDSDEAIFSTKRPLMLTSITEIVERPDLLDRAIIFDLPEIDKSTRKPEKQLWAEFEKARPGILGALLDAVSCALSKEDTVEIGDASRMADFERWAVAAESALGLDKGAFLRAYRKNQDSANDLALEASPIAEPIIHMVEAAPERKWTGTAKELFDLLLTGKTEEDKRKLKEQGWPKAPNILSGMLRRLAPNLPVRGVQVEFNIREGKKGTRKLRITKSPEPPSAPPGPPNETEKDDDGQQEYICKTSSDTVRPSAPTENKGLNQDSADDLPSFADDPTAAADDVLQEPKNPADDLPLIADTSADDLSNEPPYSEPIDLEGLLEPADDLTMTDGVLPSFSCDKRFVALDTETERFDERAGITPRTAKMIGISLSYDGAEQTTYTTEPEGWALFMPEPEMVTVMHNAKFDLGVLARAGLTPPVKWEDTMIAAHLLNETGNHGLKPLAEEHLGVNDPITYEEAEQMRLLDPGIFDEYAKNDARYTFRLWPQFQKDLENQGLTGVYELEKQVVPVVMEMEAAGMKIDLAQMSEMKDTVHAEASRIESEIYEHAGCKFDLHSPAKVGTILFDKLGVPSRKETGGGQRSVDRQALEDVRGHHPTVDAILRYREIDKLASTFLSVLPKFADEAGRIHPEFRQLGATSGRFSCSNPNVQQIPSRSELGKKLRQMFIANEGNALVVADWSQMELRILAHYSKDPLLLEAYTSATETDLHVLTASRMFGKVEADVTKAERSIAKMINFGIAYGITPIGLFNRLKPSGVDVTVEDCERFVADYFKTYRGVKQFLNKVEQVVRERGYVKSLSGRRRRVSGRSSREIRQAQNFVIQGTAADLAKMALVRLHAALPPGAKLIAMVHDEFIVECPVGQAEEVKSLMVEAMQMAPKDFIVPMVAEAKIAGNWGDAK